MRMLMTLPHGQELQKSWLLETEWMSSWHPLMALPALHAQLASMPATHSANRRAKALDMVEANMVERSQKRQGKERGS